MGGPASACSECLCVSDYLTAKWRENLVLLMPVDFITVALLPKLSDVASSSDILNIYMLENICLTECIGLFLTVNVLFFLETLTETPLMLKLHLPGNAFLSELNE
jgi:hypothetical protein